MSLHNSLLNHPISFLDVNILQDLYLVAVLWLFPQFQKVVGNSWDNFLLYYSEQILLKFYFLLFEFPAYLLIAFQLSQRLYFLNILYQLTSFVSRQKGLLGSLVLCLQLQEHSWLSYTWHLDIFYRILRGVYDSFFHRAISQSY